MGAGAAGLSSYDAGKFITSLVFSFLYLRDCVPVTNPFFFLFTQREKQSKTGGEISSFLLYRRATLAPSVTYLCYAEDNLAPSSCVTC